VGAPDRADRVGSSRDIERPCSSSSNKLDHLYGLSAHFAAPDHQACFATNTARRACRLVSSQITGRPEPRLHVPADYRAWVIVFSLAVCISTGCIEKPTRLLPAGGTENRGACARLRIRARMIAHLRLRRRPRRARRVMAARSTREPLMGGTSSIVVFAVVVIAAWARSRARIVTGFASA